MRSGLVLSLALIAAHAANAATPADERVEKLLHSLTLEEKITLISGTGFGTHPISRLGIPAFQMSDGPLGVRALGPSTAFAGGVALAASWDTQLAKEIGTQMGR